MDTKKIKQIKTYITSLWSEGIDLNVLSRQVEHDYIFGTKGTNEHYRLKDIHAIAKAVDKELSPPVIIGGME